MAASPIPFARPGLDESEVERVAEVLRGPQLVHGPVAADFERGFAARHDAAHGVSLSSCTAGLHLSLLALGVGPGCRVAVPAMTHVATAHAVEFCGARPVFVDVDAETGNIDAEAVGALVEAVGIDAVIVVHYLGLPAEMDRIIDACRPGGVPVVEDCALAVGATYDGKPVGTIGVTGCFSFYPAKHITTAEGGMLVTDSDALAADVRRRKAFGYDKMLGERSQPGHYDVDMLGYNYRMSEVHAAIGSVQLGKLDGFLEARATNHRVLADGLAAVPDVVVFPTEYGRAQSSHYCLNAVLPREGSVNRRVVVAHLTESGIGTSIHYPSAVPLFRYYREKYGHAPGDFPIAEWLADQTISLPVGPHLGPDDPDRIATVFAEGVKTALEN